MRTDQTPSCPAPAAPTSVLALLHAAATHPRPDVHPDAVFVTRLRALLVAGGGTARPRRRPASATAHRRPASTRCTRSVR